MVVAYPSPLPGPMPGSFEPRPRRAASPLEGPLQQRGRQRDAAGMTSQYTYLYTPQQMALWLEWWRDDLLQGRRWFAHSLPGRAGMVPRVVRYRTVQQQLLGAGIYRVSASLEQRGASLMPAAEVGDPFFADVVLLMHYQGDFIDEKGHTVNVTGAPGFSTAPDPVLTGSHSLFAGGTPTGGGGPARLYTDFSSDFDLNSTDFTMEQWSYVPATQTRPRAFLSVKDDSDGPAGDGELEYYIGIPNGGSPPTELGVIYPNGPTGVATIGLHAVTLGAWQHSFYQRRGNEYSYGIGGFVRGLHSDAYRRPSGQKRVYIGQDTLSLNVDGFYGYLAESRITRAARYSGFSSVGDPYQVPAAPFQDS